MLFLLTLLLVTNLIRFPSSDSFYLMQLEDNSGGHWIIPGFPPPSLVAGQGPAQLGGSLCAEYLQLEREEDCQTVMQEKCFTQDATQCVTQYVKVSSQSKVPDLVL